jgi:signal transduction histidine kinase
VRPNAGLPSPKASSHAQLGSRPSWSFVAVPIKSEANDLYGVITIGRPVEQSPFSASDVALLESIAGRLAAVLHNVKLREQQTRMLLTLAHEINTPLQGILADAENMMCEAAPESEIKSLASHTLNQVQNLHLLTETIMAVLAEQTPARSFSMHSLYRPLKEACEMFSSEAALKGCDILEPKPIGSRFPEIEMSLFDLTLAFKNLIHNAIKYSFNPPRAYEGNRYIRILGHWAEEQQQAYSISIENYGVGIPQAEIDGRAIFAPYYRGVKASDRCRTGAGLGLAHVRQVIEDLHHGTISVTSKPLFGEAYLTTFVVTLPVRQSTKIDSWSAQEN